MTIQDQTTENRTTEQQPMDDVITYYTLIPKPMTYESQAKQKHQETPTQLSHKSFAKKTLCFNIDTTYSFNQKQKKDWLEVVRFAANINAQVLPDAPTQPIPLAPASKKAYQWFKKNRPEMTFIETDQDLENILIDHFKVVFDLMQIPLYRYLMRQRNRDFTQPIRLYNIDTMQCVEHVNVYEALGLTFAHKQQPAFVIRNASYVNNQIQKFLTRKPTDKLYQKIQEIVTKARRKSTYDEFKHEGKVERNTATLPLKHLVHIVESTHITKCYLSKAEWMTLIHDVKEVYHDDIQWLNAHYGEQSTK